MIGRSLSEPIQSTRRSVLLLGPRQVGKSTLLHALGPDLSIDLSSETEFFKHSGTPGLLESLVREQKPRLVLIDEIQRIPSLLNSVQFLIDSSKRQSGAGPKFLLSGSSARKLKRGHANLLPGRLETFYLSGLAARELDYQVDWKKALSTGFLPDPYFDSDVRSAQKLLSNYAASYLKEEIQAEALTRNIHGFNRFLQSVAAAATQVIDYSKLTNKAKVSRTSGIRFLEILEDTLVAQRLESFQECENADVIKHPKLFFFDVGVLNGLLGNFTPSADRIGMLYEQLVYNQIRNSALALDQNAEIFFFRTRNGVEVDFIIKLKGEVWAIEAKSGQIHDSDLDGLRAFSKYSHHRPHLVAISPLESAKRSIGKVLVCGLSELLSEMGL